MAAKLIDSHAHLDGSQFDEDRDELIAKLSEAGVEMVINPGANMESSREIVELVKAHSIVYGAVGVHPHDTVDMVDSDIEELRTLARREKIVAIGEIGLDYYYDHSPREVQKQRFREQIALAKELDLPIIVHERDAAQDVFDIISSEADGKLRGVIHCYSGSAEMAREYIKLGFYISFAGPVTFKNAKKPKEVAAEIPLEHLLVETDSPYMAPVPYRGKRNDPSYVRYIAETIAELKGISYEQVAEQTNRNAKQLFFK
ncbi:putative deoxyribonuclease YcfH [Andreesenia angusta]|uniref:Putative deoxyribonuclease YcfH n=1 Tax=Andreesenia angusta TaxID=39480 RepID=A0A1S1V4J8_9FIRM|nr:TatD family hydrolase [Andreesenia angusta]OHW61448.1 putative deoxyribonuclease YcfH [Andreesenia angusta]